MKLILCGGGWAEKTVIPNKVFESLMQFEPNVKYKTDEFIRTVKAV